MDIDAMSPIGSTVALAVSTTDASVTLTSQGTYTGAKLMIYNDGPNTAFLCLNAAATIPTGGGGSAGTGFPLASGATRFIDLPSGTNVLHGICQATKSATVYATLCRGGI